ncbi:hypothetical protein J4573_49355 [Actinomadura barringtoniae]|uniref:AAA+ ATPase domain-containing protein n=1 Tax=Actinomadura barringtoniae TaxID=1427535 RepID=A0A939PLU3_9ACTN|nr:hypothetical protein [Actinomadura barringtoniae]MBO2455171.1 hypothetical protein [Actinomadura barringtoniae]
MPAVTQQLADAVCAAEREVLARLIGGPGRPIAVEMVLHTGAADPLPRAGIEDVLADWRGRRPVWLAVVGGPGSGKTVRIIDLMLRLLAERGPDDPVPVRLDRALRPAGADLGGWIVAVLESYGLSTADARLLDREQKVVPVLDDLRDDVAAVVEHLGHRPETRVIVGQRVRAPDEPPAPRTIAEIGPMGPDRQRADVAREAAEPERWQPVLDELTAHPRTPLGRELSRPWRFRQAVTALEERGPDGRYLHQPRDLLGRLSVAELLADAPGADRTPPYDDDEQVLVEHARACLEDQRVSGYIRDGHVDVGSILARLDLVHMAEEGRKLSTHERAAETRRNLNQLEEKLSRLRSQAALRPGGEWQLVANASVNLLLLVMLRYGVVLVGTSRVISGGSLFISRGSLLFLVGGALVGAGVAALQFRRPRHGAFLGVCGGVLSGLCLAFAIGRPAAFLPGLLSYFMVLYLARTPDPKHWGSRYPASLILGDQAYRKAAAKAEAEWLREARDAVIIPELTRAINGLLGADFYRYLYEYDTAGLKRVHDLRLFVPTRSRARVEATLNRSDSASIAIAGPRGAGKSTLLRSILQEPRQFAVSASAPAEYVPKDFLVELFQRLCEQYVECYGKRAMTWRARALRLARPVRRVAVQALYLVVALGVLVVLFDWQGRLAMAYRWTSGHLDRFLLGLRGSWHDWEGWAAGLAVVCLAGVAAVAYTRRRRSEQARLVRRARSYTARLRKEHTTAWTLTANMPGGRGGFARGGTAKELPWNLPELVGEFQRFLKDIAEAEAARGRRVLVAIDEVDRIGSITQAERFVSEIKAVFGIPHCFYLVSVAEEVGSVFARRAVAGRSVFENAFDEVVMVQALSGAEAQHLLQKRVLGLTDPFVYLVHALSGGLPRELIRVTRRLIEVNNETDTRPRLSMLAYRLVREDVSDALAGTRSHLTQLAPGPPWAPVFDELRTRMSALDDGAPLLPILTALATFEDRLPSTGPADGAQEGAEEPQTQARAAVVALAALADHGQTVAMAFSEPQFDIETVRAARPGSDASYTELSAARRELSISPQSARATLARFRRATAWTTP